MSDNLACAPAAVPAKFEAALQLLPKQTRTLFDFKMVPYFIQAQFSEGKYFSVEDVADRWNTPEDARQQAPAELKFRDGENDYDSKESKLAAMRLYQAIKMAKLATQGPGSPSSTSGLDVGRGMPGGMVSLSSDSSCERSHLELQFMALYRVKPSLEDQGSDSLLRRQFSFCKRGEVGFIQVKHIVSYLPELDERQNKRQRKSLVSGFLIEEDDEERSYPTTFKQMEHLHKVFYTNLLMCIAAFPQYQKLAVSLEEVSQFYSWLHGPSISTRSPPPSVGVVIRAERLAWKEIAKHMHLGKTLSESLTILRTDLLFWSREVYEKVMLQSLPSGKGNSYSSKGRGKFDRSSRPLPAPYQRDMPPKGAHGPKGGKGKAKGKNKSKGKDKSKAPSGWPSNWATTTPRGLEFCHSYHLRNNCQGNCGRSHNCPVTKDGWVCNQPPEAHHPSKCPSA